MPCGVQVSLRMSIGPASTITGTVVDVLVDEPSAAGSSSVRKLKNKAMRITPRRRPEMASAARTPAVAWTAGRGAVGRGP